MNSIKNCYQLIIYKISIDLIYIFCVSKFFSYAGFTLNIFAYKYILSMLLIILFSRSIYKYYNSNSILNIIITLLNFLYFIPGCSIYSLMGLPDMYLLLFILYWGLLFISLKFIPDFKFKNNEEKPKQYLTASIIIAILGICVVFITGYYNKFNITLNLGIVYDLRKAAHEISIPTIFLYIKTWAARLIPIAIIYYLIKGKKLLAFLYTFILLLLFSFEGSKTLLSMIAIAYISYFFYSKERFNSILKYFIIINCILVLYSLVTNSCPLIVSYIHRRVLFIPNQLSYYYFEYFSKFPIDLLRQSFLRHFGLISPYSTKIAYVIAEYFFNKPEMSSNTGLIGDAFSNFGWYSLMIYPILNALTLKLINACSKKLNPKIWAVVGFSVFNSLVNGGFFTVLLTEGVLLMCLLLSLLGKSSENSLDNKT